MAERYAITKESVAEGAAVPEGVKLKLARNAALAEEKVAATAAKKKEHTEVRHQLKMRTLKYDKDRATGPQGSLGNTWKTYTFTNFPDFFGIFGQILRFLVKIT